MTAHLADHRRPGRRIVDEIPRTSRGKINRDAVNAVCIDLPKILAGGAGVSELRQKHLNDLIAFLRTIQKPNRPIEQIAPEESLVASGMIDSLTLVEIVVHLENTCGIDFSAHGFEPERLASMTSIHDFIEQAGA